MSLAGVALTLALQPLASEAAPFTAGTAAELVSAINTANSTAEADTITLTADITLTTVDNPTYGPTGLPVVSSALTIAGDHHTIRREPTNPALFRLLAVNSSGNLTLQDTTLSGGHGVGPGGGIYNHEGQLTLTGSTISGNSTDSGAGGIFSSGNTVVLTNSMISGNTGGTDTQFEIGGVGGAELTGRAVLISYTTISGNTGGDGAERSGGVGGAVISGTTVTLAHSTISGNTGGYAFEGGGVGGAVISGATVSLTDSRISGNMGTLATGGLTLTGDNVAVTHCTLSDNLETGSRFALGGSGGGKISGRTVVLKNSLISGNTATYGSGGGVRLRANAGDTIWFLNNTVSGNTAPDDRESSYGGGVYAYAAGGTVILMNNTVSGNSAQGGGGVSAFEGSGGTMVLRNSTISGNTAALYGGGIVASYNIQLDRNLIAGNTVLRAAFLNAGAEVMIRGIGFSPTFNLFGHDGLTTAQALYGVPSGGSNIVATSDGNKPTALADILDTTLRNNGGPTFTHNLVSNSPAIDAAGATCDLTTDQRSAPRPVDGNSDGVAACDIGAVEFGATPPPFCGNGVVEAGEQCDDGNTVSEDGCSATCQSENP